ncbi:uncharacterized protein [Solanum tuberosum]|uniref:uncharacterized protein n=1 Tax=Solanum tuberosum TaxID=4113 RepID=UPI00073A2665|nr:PREDICTED: uncharacterized protein LOC107059718 [Solanum tuberosum]
MLVEKYVDLKTVYTPTDIRADMLRIHGISLTYIQAWRALDASIRGWEYKRLGVLSTNSSRGCYCCIDHILPLAYGIVDSENDDSWLWFFENFKNAFGEREDMCFVSDRNKSIWNVTASVYPEFRHYACIYHLWTNLLKKTYIDTEEVRTLFFSLAKAYTVQEFDELMQRMDQINPKYRAYLQKANYEKWLPVVPLLEFVRKTIEAWNEKQNEEEINTTNNLDNCGRFQYDEIPCSHALAAIRYRNKHRDDYCSAYYSNKNYQDTYAIPIEPLPCESTWDVPSHVLEEVILPPITRKQPGRPPKNDRKKGFTEGKGKKRKVTCSECGIVGQV